MYFIKVQNEFINLKKVMVFFWYMCIFECICVHLNACRSPQRSEEDFVSSVELEVVVSAGTVNPGPLQSSKFSYLLSHFTTLL